MKRLVPLFLALAAFFLTAGIIARRYNEVRARPAPDSIHLVGLWGDHAVPAQIIIETRQSVQFSAQDGLNHNMVQTDAVGPPLSSGLIKPYDSYAVEFKTAGSYFLADKLHPQIRVNVVVYDPAN